MATITFFDKRTEQTVTVPAVPDATGTLVPILAFGQATWHAHRKPSATPEEDEESRRRQPLVLDFVLSARWPLHVESAMSLVKMLVTLADDPRTREPVRAYARLLLDRMQRVTNLLATINYTVPVLGASQLGQGRGAVYAQHVAGLSLAQFRKLLDELRCVIATPRKRLGEEYENGNSLTAEDKTAVSYFERDDIYYEDKERRDQRRFSGPDCSGRDFHISTLRTARGVRTLPDGTALQVVRRLVLEDPSYAGKRDPINDDGIYRDYFVCCGQPLDHPGCLIDAYSPSTGQSMSTTIGGAKFRPYVIIEQLESGGIDQAGTIDALARRWLGTYRRGTAYLNLEPYDILDRKIKELLPSVARSVAAGFLAVYERPPYASAWFDAVGSDMLNRLVRIYSFIHEYNAYRCRAGGFVPPQTPFEWIRFFETAVIKPEMAYEAGLNRAVEANKPFPGYVQRGKGAPGSVPVLDTPTPKGSQTVFDEDVFITIRRTPLFLRGGGGGGGGGAAPQQQQQQQQAAEALEDMTTERLRRALGERRREYEAAVTQTRDTLRVLAAATAENRALNKELEDSKIELTARENLYRNEADKNEKKSRREAVEAMEEVVARQNATYNLSSSELGKRADEVEEANANAEKAKKALDAARLAFSARLALDEQNPQVLLEARRVKQEEERRVLEEAEQLRTEDEQAQLRLDADRQRRFEQAEAESRALQRQQRAELEAAEAARKARIEADPILRAERDRLRARMNMTPEELKAEKEAEELAEKRRKRKEARKAAEERTAREKAAREAATPVRTAKTTDKFGLVTPTPAAKAEPPVVDAAAAAATAASPSTPLLPALPKPVFVPSPTLPPPPSNGNGKDKEEEDDATSPGAVTPLPSSSPPAVIPSSPLQPKSLLIGGQLRADARAHLIECRQLLNRIGDTQTASIRDFDAGGVVVPLWNTDGTSFNYDAFNRNCTDYIVSVLVGEIELEHDHSSDIPVGQIGGLTAEQYRLLFLGAGHEVVAAADGIMGIPALEARIVHDRVRNALTDKAKVYNMARNMPVLVTQWARAMDARFEDRGDTEVLMIPSRSLELEKKNLEIAGRYWANFLTMLLEATTPPGINAKSETEIYAVCPKVRLAAEAIHESLAGTAKGTSTRPDIVGYYRHFQLQTTSGDKFDPIKVVEGEYMESAGVIVENDYSGSDSEFIGAENREKTLEDVADTLLHIEDKPFYVIYDADLSQKGITVPVSIELDGAVNRTLLRPVLEAYARAVQKVGGQNAFAQIVPIDVQKDLGLLKTMTVTTVPATADGVPPQKAHELRSVKGLTHKNTRISVGIGHLPIEQQIDILRRWGQLAKILNAILTDGHVTAADVALLAPGVATPAKVRAIMVEAAAVATPDIVAFTAAEEAKKQPTETTTTTSAVSPVAAPVAEKKTTATSFFSDLLDWK